MRVDNFRDPGAVTRVGDEIPRAGSEGWLLCARHAPRILIATREGICEAAWKGAAIAAHIARHVLCFERYGLNVRGRMYWTFGHVFRTSEATELHKLGGTAVLMKDIHIVCPHIGRAVGSL
jgi:hypothetical protein